MRASISVDDNTLYTCFVAALPAAEYALEIRDLNLKQVYDRKGIINLVRRKFETLGKSKGSADPLALVVKGGSGQRKKGGKAKGGQGRSEKGKEGNGNANSKGGEPVKRRFRWGNASGAGLPATTAKIAPQRSVNDVVGEDTR